MYSRSISALLLLLSSIMPFCSIEAQKHKEGFFYYREAEEIPSIISLFVPLEPTILLLESGNRGAQTCKEKWPHALVYTSLQQYQASRPLLDLIWVDDSFNMLDLMRYLRLPKGELKVLYESHQHPRVPSHVSRDRELADSWSLGLCSRWLGNGGQRDFLYLNQTILKGYCESLCYAPPALPLSFPSFCSKDLKSYLSPIEEPTRENSWAYVDCVYMINLDERPSKWAVSQSHLSPYEIYPRRVRGINGWKLSVADLNQLGLRYQAGMLGKPYMGAVFREIEGKEHRSIEFLQVEGRTYFCAGITRGAIGCVLSHLSVLQDAYTRGFETIWVMEDDVVVKEDPLKLVAYREQLDAIDPDWDILFTDPNTKNSQGEYVACGALAMRPDIAIPPLDSFLRSNYLCNEDLCRVGMRYGAYSMIVRRSGIEKILDYYDKHNLFLPYDADFWLIPSLRMYGVNRDIVTTLPDALTDNATTEQ